VRKWFDRHGGVMFMLAVFLGMGALGQYSQPDGGKGAEPQVAYVMNHCKGEGDIKVEQPQPDQEIKLPRGRKVTGTVVAVEGYPKITEAGACVHTRALQPGEAPTVQPLRIRNGRSGLGLSVKLKERS
jgi:hypothetical protein